MCVCVCITCAGWCLCYLYSADELYEICLCVSDLGADVHVERTVASENSQEPSVLMQSVSWRSAVGHH